MQFKMLLFEGSSKDRLEERSQERVQVLWGESNYHDLNLIGIICLLNLQIGNNEVLGRFMIAKRNIKAGEIILRETPSVLGPKISSHVMCLGCHQSITPPPSGDYYKCSKCSWPVCGKSCENLSSHVDECSIMHEKNYMCSIRNTGKSKTEAAYCVIVPLRVMLLKASNPKQ